MTNVPGQGDAEADDDAVSIEDATAEDDLTFRAEVRQSGGSASYRSKLDPPGSWDPDKRGRIWVEAMTNAPGQGDAEADDDAVSVEDATAEDDLTFRAEVRQVGGSASYRSKLDPPGSWDPDKRGR